jgi:hypothetical protein
MTSEEDQQARDVVLSMFLGSSRPTTVLFDSGASHSVTPHVIKILIK